MSLVARYSLLGTREKNCRTSFSCPSDQQPGTSERVRATSTVNEMMNMVQPFNSFLKKGSLSPELVKRVSAGSLIFGCLLLVVWSITFRLSLVTEAQSHMYTSFSLGRQVASLEELWSEDEAEAVRNEWAAAKKGSFEHYPELVQWVAQMNVQAQSLGLELTYRIDEASSPVQGVPDVQRVAMEMTLQAKNPAQGYHQFMQFVRSLSEETLKMNFESIELLGLGQGALKMELRLHTFLQQPV